MERLKKEDKTKFMEKMRKAGDPDNYETSWDEKGGPKSKKKSEIKKGRTSRARGARFELQVRRDLEEKGRVVDKWNNNVDLPSKDTQGGHKNNQELREPLQGLQAGDSGEPDEGKLVIAKRKYNPFSKVMTIGVGFPDFISIKKVTDDLYSVIGVEVKMNGILSKEEKEKCAWYLKNGIFSQIWIAKKGGKRGEIKYDDFGEKYGGKFC